MSTTGGMKVAAKTKPQQTLAKQISCSGVGLHGGMTVNMTILPAAPNTGIVFERVDIEGEARRVPARADAVGQTCLGTVVSNEADVKVSTVEHLMAAFAGCGIDNAVVEVDAPEIPVMDGSSAPFVRLIECAGIQQQAAPRRYIRVKRRVEIADGLKLAALEPHDGFAVDFEIDFDSQAIGRQSARCEFADMTFKTELADARTFGFLRDKEALQQAGLALGASLENTVVIDEDTVMNEDGLRSADEFVRHKALDAVGDLYLAGAPILGRYSGVRAGHALNNQLLRALLADPAAFEITTEAPAGARAARTGGAALGNAAAAPA